MQVQGRLFKATGGYRGTCLLAKGEGEKASVTKTRGSWTPFPRAAKSTKQFTGFVFPLQMVCTFSSHWSRDGAAGTTYKGALCLHQVSPQALHTEERKLVESKDCRGYTIQEEEQVCLNAIYLQTPQGGQVRVARLIVVCQEMQCTVHLVQLFLQCMQKFKGIEIAWLLGSCSMCSIYDEYPIQQGCTG